MRLSILAPPLLILAALPTLASEAAGARPQPSDPGLVDFLKASSSPEDYVLSKTREHRVVLLGEAHWIRHDADLVSVLVPRLKAAGVTTLACETLRASDQPAIDALLRAPQWDEGAAMRLLRNAEWPYEEYLQILRAAWEAARADQPVRVLALSPGADWRETLLPKGVTYDDFMAELVAGELRASPQARILIYAGLNHTFTRYHQPERPRVARVEAFFDRMGNILWRKVGEDAFFIILNHPWRCEVEGKPSRCLPTGEAFECAAAALGRRVGFDVPSSPMARRSLAGFEYALGYPDLRLVDMADGLIWQEPIRSYASVTLISLDRFAPDEASLKQVEAHPPFGEGPASSRAELEAQWRQQEVWLSNAASTRDWSSAIPACEAGLPPKPR